MKFWFVKIIYIWKQTIWCNKLRSVYFHSLFKPVRSGPHKIWTSLEILSHNKLIQQHKQKDGMFIQYNTFSSFSWLYQKYIQISQPFRGNVCCEISWEVSELKEPPVLSGSSAQELQETKLMKPLFMSVLNFTTLNFWTSRAAVCRRRIRPGVPFCGIYGVSESLPCQSS